MALKVGDELPTDIVLSDQHGTAFDFAGHRGTKLVLYFYPADDTPGCTAEACTFRDSYQDFQDAGALVVGVSDQDAESHKQFAAKHNLPFTLLADIGGVVRKRLGVPKTLGILPGRVTYVIDEEGVVRHLFNSQFQASRHVAEALRVIHE